jgi:hypothetical protein
MAEACLKQVKSAGGICATSVSSLPPWGVILVAVKSYFDGGGIGKRDPFLTLACIANDKDSWPEIEQTWDEHRESIGIKGAFHMTDAMNFKGQFKGWEKEKRDQAVNIMINSISRFRQKDLFRYFAVTIDLVSHKQVKKTKSIPSGARLVARSVFPHMLMWYWKILENDLEWMDLIFDVNEPFMRHIYADWVNKKYRREHPSMEIIGSIATGIAARTPALQMADMVAWSRNRLASGSSFATDPSFGIALHGSRAIEGFNCILDREWLSRTPLPEEGFEATNPQKRKQRA